MPRRKKHPKKAGSLSAPRPRRRASVAAPPSPEPERQATAAVPLSPQVQTVPPRQEATSSGGHDVTDADAGELARAIRDAQAAQVEATTDGGAPVPTPDAVRQANLSNEELVAAADRLADGQLGVIAELTEEELGDVFALIFGAVADYKEAQMKEATGQDGLGKHWELSPKSGRRLGKWLKKSLAIHGMEWLEKWLPDVLLVVFVWSEIAARRRMDAAILAAHPALKAGDAKPGA